MNEKEANDILENVGLIPYPKLRNIGKNSQYATMLYEDFGGKCGEVTAIMTYIYQHLIIQDIDIAQIMKKIAVVEMHHLDLIGSLIKMLGKDPKYMDNNYMYWNADTIDYEKKDIRSLMKMNIQSEQEAIANYLKAKRYTRNQSVRNLLDRIILDEQSHIQVFEGIIKKYELNNIC